MSEPVLFPLERVFKTKAANRDESPDHRDDLFARYITILKYLERQVYPFVDAGLAALSEENGIYTLHNKDHFDEVVKYAGELLGCITGNESFDELNAYELFVLLVAIRIHDAGNMYGRENHEKRAYQILQNAGAAAINDNYECTFISDIAKAHGGLAPDNSKDTIGKTLSEVEEYGNVEFHQRIIAAIVRFADEICESQSRGAEKLLSAGKISKKNEVFHKYAVSIKSVRVNHINSKVSRYASPIEVRLKFDVNVKDCLRKWGKIEKGKVKQVYLIDEIFNRLEKMILERRYCNHFMRDVCNVVSIVAKIKIFEEVDDGEIVLPYLVKEIPVIEKSGYPISVHSLSKMCNITGKTLEEELKNRR